MPAQIRTLLVPNVLGGTIDEAETVSCLADAVPPVNQYIFDMQPVEFVNPYGVLVLVITARSLSRRSCSPVQLENLHQQVHLYLQRMNVFDVGYDWLRPCGTLEERWAHNPQTSNLL